MELIKKEGGKLSELAEAVDKEKVAKEIEGLGQRWDTLLKKAENRFVFWQMVFHNNFLPSGYCSAQCCRYFTLTIIF